MSKNTFTYNKHSNEVINAKLSTEAFETTIFDCYKVNGSKYKPGHWEEDIFEVVTSDGVFISKNNVELYKNKKILVNTNKNSPDITWVWLNYLNEFNSSSDITPSTNSAPDRFLDIQDALQRNPPNTLCFVYKLIIGTEIYVGFTTKTPQERVNEHIAASKEGKKAKINIAFRKWGFIYSLEILGEFHNEIVGLMNEIIQIENSHATLNQHKGGQGKDFNIVLNKNQLGEDVYFVHDKYHILDR